MDAPPDKTPRPRGFLCPGCGTKLPIWRTRKGAGLVKRRRKCPGCGHAVTTIERPAPRPHQP